VLIVPLSNLLSKQDQLLSIDGRASFIPQE
jgi:hypothetical protein